MGVAVGAVVLWLLLLSGYDMRRRRLPNWLTLPGAAAVLTAAALAGRGSPALAGAVALAALYLVVYALAPSAMGAGDVKLALGVGAIGGYFGTDVWLLAAIAAPLLTALWALVQLLRHGEHAVPHGPSMCIATAAAAALALL